jgi:hypothetical protein
MEIPSPSDPAIPLFHSVDKMWRSKRGVCFTFAPINEADARMYIAGLVPYLKHTADPWYMNLFTQDARNLHRSNQWDPNTRQVFSTEEADLKSYIFEDAELNFPDTPTLAPANGQSPALISTQNENVKFQVPSGEGTEYIFWDPK